jgi:hypothetical protein
MEHTPFKAGVIFWLYHFFNNSFQYIVAIGIWIGLASYYKRSVKQGCLKWAKKFRILAKNYAHLF